MTVVSQKRLWLDDEREAPSSLWTRARTAKEAIQLLEQADFDVVSLDHDLGEGAGTGYDVANYIEERAALDPEFKIPEVLVHTDNGPARVRMALAAESIRRIKERRGQV